MLERFTTDARQIVIRAREEATDLNHPEVGTQHLLLALLEIPGTASDVLRAAGLDPHTIRAGLQQHAGSALPGLTEEDAKALRSVGIDLDAVVARIHESFGPDALRPRAATRRGWLGRRARRSELDEWIERKPRVRFGPRSKKVLELSLRETVRLHDDRIDTGHLLLGLLREGGGRGAQILTAAGADFAVLREQTETALRRAA